jgi:5-(carboxyamino)imidazole ribonucleotide synthase
VHQYFPKVLIIGAGQLARMMIESASRLGIAIRLLANDKNESAAQLNQDNIYGDYSDLATVLAAVEDVSVVTFDHEHVPLNILEQIEKLQIKVRPSITALACAQNKIYMRETLAAAKIANPDWLATNSISQAQDFFLKHQQQLILKSATGGYDGKGVWEINEVKELNEFFKDPDQVWLCEQKVDFKRELAVQVVRSPSNQVVVYQPVETRQKNGICNEVIAPAPDLPESLNIKIQQLGLKIAQTLDVTGVFSVELFQTQTDEIFVNELAMRPHNSGHWSIDGAVTSQFENHLRAILDLPLGSPAPTAKYTVMANILGGDFEDLYQPYLHCLARDPQLKVHLYGKSVKPGRKVGHVNVSGNNWQDLLVRARHAADYFTGTITE